MSLVSRTTGHRQVSILSWRTTIGGHQTTSWGAAYGDDDEDDDLYDHGVVWIALASAEKYGDKEGFLVFYRVLFPIGVSQTLSRFNKTYDEVHIWIGLNVFFKI